MSELNNRTTLVMGDWSDDGHGKTDLTIINSNLAREQILKAYKKASKKLGFDLTKDICADYCDSHIPVDCLKALVQNGLDLDKVFDTDYDVKEARQAMEGENSEDVALWPHSFIEIFLFIVKLGNQDFEYEIVESDAATINIGGYGLFE